ncbi:MAG: DNA uptake protein, partial [Oxalobacteraceae bacterium]
GGDFKDWPDFEKRVKGIGAKNSTKLSAAGLTVNGKNKQNAPAAAKMDKKVKSAAQSKAATPATAMPGAPASAPAAAPLGKDKKTTP